MVKLPKIKRTFLIILTAAALSAGSGVVPAAASALSHVPTTIVAQDTSSGTGDCSDAAQREKNRDCVKSDCKVDASNGEQLNKSNCRIVYWAVIITQALSALVGIVVVIMIVVGGIQYSASRDNPQATAAAKGRVVNALLALLIYLVMFSFLQWAVPGGIF